jgi:hypothetical protein
MVEIADPRTFCAPDDVPEGVRRVHRLAAESLAAPTGQAAQSLDGAVAAAIGDVLGAADPVEGGRRLAAWLEIAPSIAVRRHLWRSMVRATSRPRGGAVATTLFAIPLVLVAGVGGDAGTHVTLSGVLPRVDELVALLTEHGALGGNRSFSLAGALQPAEALDIAALPALLAAAERTQATGAPLALSPGALSLPSGESVHLRFLVGSALGSADVDVTRDSTTGRWGRPLTASLVRQLTAPGVALLPLPRPAATPLAAVAQGRLAQRDVSAQLFASNAIRQLRASVGEPTAVISAHLAADAPGGGELRLSLSSELAPRDAHGFRCPLLPVERAAEAAKMLIDLLADARVDDVRIVSGVHADRDAVTGGPLLFKPATIPAAAAVQ